MVFFEPELVVLIETDNVGITVKVVMDVWLNAGNVGWVNRLWWFDKMNVGGWSNSTSVNPNINHDQ